MPQHVVIDGNNLLYAVRARAPVQAVGRETLVRLVERWAYQRDDTVTVVFDGPIPAGGFSRQMSSGRLAVRFSAPQTADDVIVATVYAAKRPDMLSVVTDDRAIRREAVVRRCRHISAADFVDELFRRPSDQPPAARAPGEKPTELSPEEAQEWANIFDTGAEDDEGFDGEDAMRY